MRSSRRFAPLVVAVLLGCPGSAKFKLDGRSDILLAPMPDSSPIVISDLSPVDGAVKGQESSLKKDTTIASDLGPTSVPGGPCPCKSPLLCVKQACRQPCAQLICNGSSCSAAEACVMTVIGTPVCVPANGAGAACNGSTFCGTGTMCLGAPNTADGKCYATCTGPGQPCANCTILPNNCSFCP